jgi:hypothetical protein
VRKQARNLTGRGRSLARAVPSYPVVLLAQITACERYQGPLPMIMIPPRLTAKSLALRYKTRTDASSLVFGVGSGRASFVGWHWPQFCEDLAIKFRLEEGL